MPILINQQSGLAEDLPQDQATAALTSGTHELPLNDPDGNPVTATVGDAPNLLAQGYTQPNTNQLGSLMTHSRMQGAGQQTKAALEGAAEGILPFGVSTAIETGSGMATPEDITARKAEYPGTETAGQVAGLLGSSFIPGIGQANLAEHVGAAAAGLLGLGEAVTPLAKIGSAIVQNAVQGAMITGGDEASKAFAQDPDQTAELAMTHIGLNGLLPGAVLGGLVGSVPLLWAASKESTSIGQTLNAITSKANGLGRAVLPDASLDTMAQTAGMTLDPMTKAALSDNPYARELFQNLDRSATGAGREATQTMNQVRSNANQAILSALGKTPEDAAAVSKLSDFDQGSNIVNSIKTELQPQIDTFNKQYSDITDQFSKVPFEAPPGQLAPEINTLSDNIAKMAQERGSQLVPGTPEASVIGKVMDALPNVTNLEDLRKVGSQIGNMTSNDPALWNLGKSLKGVFRDTESGIVEKNLAATNPDLLPNYQATKSAYGAMSETIEDLNNRLRVGNYAGPGTFLKLLDEMKPEDVLNRMTPKNDAGLLDTLNQKFPQTAQAVKESYMNKALQIGVQRPFQGEPINTGNMLKALDQWSPELKQFVLPPKAPAQLTAIQGVLSKIPKNMNPPDTAKTLDSIWSKMGGGAMSMISLMSGHNPVVGYLLGTLARYLGRDAPDAIKLATLKFLGSPAPVSSTGFKALADYISSSQAGRNMTTNAIKAVFKRGAQVIPQGFEAAPEHIAALKDKIAMARSNPSSLLPLTGELNHYAGEHSASFGAVAARAVNTIGPMKPNTDPMGTLGANRVPTAKENADYERQLSLAHQPLGILEHIKTGTIIPQDVATVKNIYPAFSDHVTQGLTNQVMEMKQNGEPIPYQTRVAMSMFMATPLDNTMTPQGIMMAQAGSVSAQNQPAQQGGSPQKSPRTKSSMESLSKGSNMMMSSNQARESARQSATA